MVSTSHLWTSHTHYKRSIATRKIAAWNGTMRWSNLCGAYNCLHLRHLHTHGYIMYHWKAVFTPVTMKHRVEPINDVVHVHWRSNKVIINLSILKMVYSYVFINVRKATSYATRKLIASSYCIGLFYRATIIALPCLFLQGELFLLLQVFFHHRRLHI